jgi:hypothetical protein
MAATTQQQKEPITLLPWQRQHAARLRQVLDDFPFAIDLSMLGSGKTYTASHLAQNLGFSDVIVVSPTSVKPKWLCMQHRYDVRFRHALGYGELRGVRGKQPRHGLLTRRDFTVTVRARRGGRRRGGEVAAAEMIRQAAGGEGGQGCGAEEEAAGAGEGRRDLTLERVSFTPTPAYLDLLDRPGGLLLIVDEVQNIKNMTAQFRACQALIRPIVQRHAAGNGGARSRVLLLSGSPLDKPEQATLMFRTLHVMRRDDAGAYDLATRAMCWTGMQDVVSFCARLDACQTRGVVSSLQAADLVPLAYQLFQRVLKPAVASAMPPPDTGAHRVQFFNAYYPVQDPADLDMIARGVAELSSAARYNAAAGTVSLGGGDTAARIGRITCALQQIERGKLATFARAAREALQGPPRGESSGRPEGHLEPGHGGEPVPEDGHGDRFHQECHCPAAAAGVAGGILPAGGGVPHPKVVVCVNYKASLEYLARELSDFRPLILQGSTKLPQRVDVMSRFQAPSGAHRLLLGNVAVCSTGIDLDDKDGRFPRLALVSPNYNSITMYQLGHRFVRAGSRSPATVHMVYAEGVQEAGVMAALARKSQVMKDTTREQAEGGVVFPGDYQGCSVAG